MDYPKMVAGVEVVPPGGVFQDVYFPWNNLWDFPNMKQTKVRNLNIGEGPDTFKVFKGLLEYLPDSYNLPANAEKKYPVILYFHGRAALGLGDYWTLCRLFKDRGDDMAGHLSVPGRVERNSELFSQPYGGTLQEYIVISPQYSHYERLRTAPRKDTFPTAGHIEDMIDYVEANYRIDRRRIFLTGMSAGANMIMEYAASSLERAKRVAAVMPIALCSQLYHSDNVSRGYDAKYIGEAQLPTWFVYCEKDDCGSNKTVYDVPMPWIDKIKSIPGHKPPRVTKLKNENPAYLYHCSDTILHDAWSRAYNPEFRASFVNGTGANDGINLNMYEWFAQQENIHVILPVVMKSYTARLVDDRVELKWITTEEQNNASFVIERAGADQQFAAIGTVPGAVNHSGEKAYSFTDTSPLPDLSFYRLVQIDIDGKKTYFDIKKILNKKGNTATVVVSPNPIARDVSAFISISKPQKVSVLLTDMSGKPIRQVNGIYGQGSSEIRINASDLSNGVYLLKVLGEDFNVTQKIIK
ncbi:MAG TPA: T9SS type A sorting domain-containing protein [Flavitalea sp.]|nr:T9SS type A sorting domain-containing protein [Flavitalea sp.]